ncbi:hypothetical protein ACFLWA_07355 [Chloroflexota bacterium]
MAAILGSLCIEEIKPSEIDKRRSIDNLTLPSNGIARFIPGLALFKGLSPALLCTELVVAVAVFGVFVPSAMAYGDLAGVIPVAGLPVALGSMVMYVLFGTK